MLFKYKSSNLSKIQKNTNSGTRINLKTRPITQNILVKNSQVYKKKLKKQTNTL